MQMQTEITVAAVGLVVVGVAFLFRDAFSDMFEALLDRFSCQHDKEWSVIAHDPSRELPYRIRCGECKEKVWVDADHVGDADPAP